MISISNDTNIYVYCPSKVVTGGAELLHQLVHVLNSNQKQAFIVYFDGGTKVPTAYEKYNIKIAQEIKDTPNNIIVYYEGIFDKVLLHKNAQKLLWWLSVDNLYYNSKKYLNLLDYLKWNFSYGIYILAYRLGYFFMRKQFLFGNTVSINYLSKNSNLNCYQSEYAQHFLINKKFKELLPLSDYINSDFINNIKNTTKENIVLYNPKKGFKHTKKLIALAPHLNWVALEGMSRQQLSEVFSKSKLYIDFGFHPGKDRLPREAVLNNCCIISGCFGSANFFEDVAINNEYKINLNEYSYKHVISKIEDILNNYNKHIQNFEFYKQRTINEETTFTNQVKQIFSIQ